MDHSLAFFSAMQRKSPSELFANRAGLANGTRTNDVKFTPLNGTCLESGLIVGQTEASDFSRLPFADVANRVCGAIRLSV